MKLNKFAPKKNVAQAMVEFAIVLPILLLLLYGLLETGRLLFMYSTIVTASRQAVRYGSATGIGTGGVERYRDCAGIRQAANRTDYLNAFNHDSADVQIFWDSGPSTTQNPICPVGDASSGWTPAGNNNRLVVTVTGHFNAIVKLVPFGTRNIVATSARTILVSVSIVVPPAGGPEVPIVDIQSDDPDPSVVGEIVPVVVSVSGGSGIPEGTVDIFVDANPTPVCPGLNLDTNGIATCDIQFFANGIISATYTPKTGTTAYGAAASDPSDPEAPHLVGPAPVNVTVQDNPTWSFPGDGVTITVTVRNIYDPSIIPTGSVVITNGEGGTCTETLNPATGMASCSMVFNIENPAATITASYTSDDTRHEPGTGTDTHEVVLVPPTATNTPPPTPTSTPTPPPTATLPATSTFTPTVPPTPVLLCGRIRDSFAGIQNPITVSLNTMYLDIPNPNDYSVTINTVFVSWNYTKGHKVPPKGPGTAELRLLSAEINGSIFWQVPAGDPGVLAPSLEIQPPTTIAIPPGGTRILFTFDQTYDNAKKEAINIDFSTPGCEDYPIYVTNQ